MTLYSHRVHVFFGDKNIKFKENETESKMENPTHSFREMNHVLQLVCKNRELKVKL